MKVKSESEVARSYPNLRDPMDCSLPGSSIHGIFQARVLEWGAIAFSERMSQSSTIAADSEGELASPEGTQEGTEEYQPGEAIRLQLLLRVSPEEIRM